MDAQLPPALCEWLQAKGYDAEHVGPSAKDWAIWDRARDENWVILTKDRDFAVWVTARGPGPSVVWVRLGNATTGVLTRWLEPRWPMVEQRLLNKTRLVEVGRP